MFVYFFFFLMIRRPPRSTLDRSSAASDVYKRQLYGSDAMTGVVQVFTKRGTTRSPLFEFSGEGGSFGFNREWASVSGASGRFDYSGSFGYLATNGRDRNDDYVDRSATANLGYR